MRNIGLISDTHGFLHPKLFDFFKSADEIWHAGDIGNIDTLETLKNFKPTKAVFGNIDDQLIRSKCKEYLIFNCEKMKVFLIHIGGYPPNYAKGINKLLIQHKPKIFISGHSHILKVLNDPSHELLHLNPGAAGKTGLHKHITMMKFTIIGNQLKDLNILEIKRMAST